jgi:hypothetical protein
MNDIVEAGKATRWKPGTSPNPGGRPRNSISQKIRAILDRPSDLYEAARIIEQAEGAGAAERWDTESLTNGDLVALALVGIGLNRSGTVPPNVQLQALQYLTDRMDGRLSDKTPGAMAEDESKRPLMTVEEFRRAIAMKGAAPEPTPAANLVADAVGTTDAAPDRR